LTVTEYFIGVFEQIPYLLPDIRIMADIAGVEAVL
jgi:hypothetical protein